jgi:hypothetical protein
MFRPFKFLKVLCLPNIRVSLADISNKLGRDNEFELGEEYVGCDFSELALSLLEITCKALGEEVYALERVESFIQVEEDILNLSANLRRRTSTEGPWVEVDLVADTYDRPL